MNRLTATLAGTLVVAAALLGTLPAGATGDAAFSMNVAFNPNPPRQGNETIIVTLRDANHKAITNAVVTIATSMPAMSMGGPTIKATPSHAGVYVAKLNVNFVTRWKFDVIAKAGKQSVARSYTENVK